MSHRRTFLCSRGWFREGPFCGRDWVIAAGREAKRWLNKYLTARGVFELKIVYYYLWHFLCHPLFDSVSIRNVFRCVDTLFDQRPLQRQKNTISFLLEIDACQCFISLSARSLLTNLKETFTHWIEMLYQFSNTLPILICTTLVNRLLN